MPDALDTLRELRPEEAAPDPEAQQRARAVLTARIEGELAEEPRALRRPPRRRRRWLAAVLAPAAAAALALGVITGLDRGSVSPEPASALERAADAAEVRAPDLGPGEYLYVRERGSLVRTFEAGGSGPGVPARQRMRPGPPFSVVAGPATTETWMNRQGNGRYTLRAPATPLEFPGSRDRRRWIERGRPWVGKRGYSDSGEYLTDPKGFPVGDGAQLTYDDLASLPTDGRELYAELIELAGDRPPSPDVEAFRIVTDLLRFAPAPRRARAALYRATAHIKGIRMLGEVRDGLGRRGQAVEVEHEGVRSQLIFDPETSALLAERDVLAERKPWIDAEPGYVLRSLLVERQAVVGSPRERP